MWRVALEVDARGKMVSRLLFQHGRMAEQFAKVAVGLVAYPPPGTDKTANSCPGGLMYLAINCCAICRFVDYYGEVWHMTSTPVFALIPAIVKGQDRASGSNICTIHIIVAATSGL